MHAQNVFCLCYQAELMMEMAAMVDPQFLHCVLCAMLSVLETVVENKAVVSVSLYPLTLNLYAIL
jgi:hypothetical protein